MKHKRSQRNINTATRKHLLRKPAIKIKTIIFPLLTFVDSRDYSQTQGNNRQIIPTALEDKVTSYSFVSKRCYDDLAESLYNELPKKTEEPKMLENKIEALHKSKNGSTESFIQVQTRLTTSLTPFQKIRSFLKIS